MTVECVLSAVKAVVAGFHGEGVVESVTATRVKGLCERDRGFEDEMNGGVSD